MTADIAATATALQRPQRSVPDATLVHQVATQLTPFVDAVLVLHKSDLARLAEKPGLAEGQRLLFVDPGLLDEAAVRGFKNCDFRRLAPDPDFQARAATEAMTLATLVDLRLTEVRQELWSAAKPSTAARPSRHGWNPARPSLHGWNPECPSRHGWNPECPSLHGWDVGVFFLALQRAAVARQIGGQIEAHFPEHRIGLLRTTVPQQMYFDSFLSTDLLVQNPARFSVIDSYDTARWHRADAYDSVFDAVAVKTAMAGGRVTAVTHVPTCFYDRSWLASEVSRAHSFTLDLASPFWDVPLHRGGALLQPIHEAGIEHLGAAQAYRESALRVLETTLGHLLPQPLARAQQLQAWAQRCHWQAVNALALFEALAGSRPQFLLSDQDAGLNGPLFTVADALGASITVVPHSGHPSMLLPHARRVVAVERAGYGSQPRSVLGQNVVVRPVRFAQRVSRREHTQISTVCLLLNSMQTEGLSHVDAHALAAFYKPLAALCAEAGVELILRPKPGAPALSVLSSALGVPPARLVQHTTQPLEQLAEATQLCIAYGEPTTGVAPFLDGGCLLLQVGEQRWPSDYTVCLPLIRDGVIPWLDHAQALHRVQTLLADPVRFRADTQRQSDAFRVRCRDAHDHIF